MSISIRGLVVFRPLSLGRLINQTKRKLSLNFRRETTSLRFTNASYAFPLSPQGQIQPEQDGQSRPSFLEEPTEEYGHMEASQVQDSSAMTQSSSDQATLVILRLIAKGEVDRALAARDEFVKIGVKIAQDPAFASAAIAALSIIDPEVRSRQFIAWWSLTPLDECPGQLSLALVKLMEHPFDIPLLMDFCILCVKAGLARHVEKSKLFSHIFRYGHPNATTALLVKLEHEAKKHSKDASSGDWMSMRNFAIRVHLVAGRTRIATELYEGASANGLVIESETSRLLEANRTAEAVPREFVDTKVLQVDSPKKTHRSISKLAQELRILRRIVASRERPPHFERYLAEFIEAYELLGRRSRAIRMLREKVFREGTLAVRARWVLGEQMAYSTRRRPLAVLRTFANYCLADSILATEAKRILLHWRTRDGTKAKAVYDWKLSQKPVQTEWKVWPSNGSVSMAWKAILQLSSKSDITRLYSLFLQLVEAARTTPSSLAPGLAATSDLDIADKQFYDASSHAIAIPPVNFPDPYYFHHFVVAFATRRNPMQGAKVVRDMQRLGLTPSKETWGALAGAYARSGDMRRVLRIIEHVDPKFPKLKSDTKVRRRRRKQRPSKAVLATYNSVLRGLTEAGMFQEARLIHHNMQERGCFRGGIDKRTRALLHRLSRYELGKYDRALFQSKRKVVRVIVDNCNRRVAVDEKRTEWLHE